MPATITRGGQTTSFAYGPEHQRIRQTTATGRRYYLGLEADAHAELEVNAQSGLRRWTNYHYGPSRHPCTR